jgi:DNA glycosylase AlkZ-like
VTTERLARARMFNQRLWGNLFDDPEAVVGWLGAMQAQEFAIAKWSIGLRATATSQADVSRAFDEGTILRSHFLRPTWHFALARDIRWLLTATAPRVQAVNAYHNRHHGIDEELAVKANAVVERALQGGRYLTRQELGARLDRVGIPGAGPRLAYLIMRAELDGIAVSGPMRGKQHTYALLDERAPDALRLDRDEAIAELTRRFFVSRGPATLKDLARWSSLTAGECRAGLEMVKSSLEQDEIDGRVYWFAESPGSATSTRRPRVDLVQGYDEIIMSYSESKDVVAPTRTDLVIRDRRVFLHAILLDGRLIGHWRHDPPKGSVGVETILHRSLDPSEARALDAAVDRYGRFLGLPASLRQAGGA